jgi:hypothetical protein
MRENSYDEPIPEVEITGNNYEVGGVKYIISQITCLAPETLNTLQELAQSINNDNTFYNTINNQLASKANSADVYTNFHHSQRLKLITSSQKSKIPLH